MSMAQALIAVYGAGSPPSVVSFVAASGTTYVTAASQAQTIPSAATGDLAIAFVMHRSALTSPSGWTLVLSQSCVNAGTSQFLSIYKKVLASGEPGTSTTWTQATSGRMAVHMQTFHKSGGSPDVLDSLGITDNLSTSSTVTWPALTMPAGSSMACFSATEVLVSPGAGWVVVGSNGTLTTPTNADDNRLAVAYGAFSPGTTISGSFIRTDSNVGLAKASIAIG